MPVKDPAFIRAGEKAGVEIWRIENFAPVKLDRAHHGTFYRGDCYIILSTISNRGTLSRDLYYLVGPECSQDEKGTCAIKAVELDDSLGGSCIQHREVGGHESDSLRSLFKNGIKSVKGGVKSAFKHVGSQKFPKHLYQVKGKRRPIALEVPVSANSLNNGDSFILDCGLKIYVFNGTFVGINEKRKAVQMAIRIRDDERDGSAVIHVIDAKIRQQIRTSVQLEQDEETLKFFEELGCNKVHEIKSADDGGDDSQADKAEVRLYSVVENDGKVTMKEVGEKPLKRGMLNSGDVFILETTRQVFVWIGRHASQSEKGDAMKKAEGFVAAKNLPVHTSITAFKEELEPALFMSYFSDWSRVFTKEHYTQQQKSSSRVANVQQTKFDARRMHEEVAKKEAKMLDDGSGDIKLFRVKDFDLEAVPREKHGVFYSGDCYVLLYTYNDRGGREKSVVYFWIGNESSKDEQGTAAHKAVEIDDSLGSSAMQVRVVEDKEPPHFLKIFNNRMIVHQGGHRSGFKNTTEPVPGAPAGSKLFQIHVSDQEFRAVEVIPRTASLNSADAFVLDVRSTVYIWCGKGCSGDEREFAKEMAKKVNPRDYQILTEGSEPQQFWNVLGGKGPYASAKLIKEVAQEQPPRLFHASNASGRFVVQEVPDFEQEDMNEDDVMILDVFSEVYIWLGKDSNRKERELSVTATREYLASDPRGSRAGTTIFLTKQGCEPLAFSMHFMPWDPDFWSKKMPYSAMLQKLKDENEHKATVVEQISKVSSGPKETFPVDELRKPPEQLPLSVDPTKKEEHLTDQDFQALFKMTRKQFQEMPNWKKDKAKQAVDLF